MLGLEQTGRQGSMATKAIFVLSFWVVLTINMGSCATANNNDTIPEDRDVIVVATRTSMDLPEGGPTPWREIFTEEAARHSKAVDVLKRFFAIRTQIIHM